jgi:GNAT superfamily N-acetyltransferase
MKLVTVKGNPDAGPFLYELLGERPKYAWISHGEMPSRSAHEHFVANHPFLYWYLIDVDGTYVGAIEATDRNELGVHILARHQRKGYGMRALKMFMEKHQPLPPIKAVRNEKWLANIGTLNMDAKDFFEKAGFAPLQETWVKR